MLDGVRVLLVENSEDELAMYEIGLRALGARVRTATRAVHALERLLADGFDVMVSDLALPEMDGFQLIQEVRALAPDRGGDLLAIAVTGLLSAHERSAALRAGYDAFCEKPCPPEELAKTIATCLRQRQERLETGRS